MSRDGSLSFYPTSTTVPLGTYVATETEFTPRGLKTVEFLHPLC